jgi:nitrate reductase molybdenum cofactor assembly chaperone NarJ/NarW
MVDAGHLDDRAQRLTYQAASLLLGYPDAELRSRLTELAVVVADLPPQTGGPLAGLVEHLARTGPIAVEQDYVETFDLRRRCSLYLTYYAYGDTRKRGQALLSFKHAYRQAGLVLNEGELPDHLSVVLEFAATADLAAGRKLLLDHRAGLELLALALRDAQSPYAAAVAAVTATLPRLRGDEQAAVRRLVAEGPPEEEVGLEPFAPPEYMGARR